MVEYPFCWRRTVAMWTLAALIMVVVPAVAGAWLGPVVFGQAGETMPGLMIDQWLPLVGK